MQPDLQPEPSMAGPSGMARPDGGDPARYMPFENYTQLCTVITVVSLILLAASIISKQLAGPRPQPQPAVTATPVAPTSAPAPAQTAPAPETIPSAPQATAAPAPETQAVPQAQAIPAPTAPAVMPAQSQRPGINIESGLSKAETLEPAPSNKAAQVQRSPAAPSGTNDGKKPDLKKPALKQPDLKSPSLKQPDFKQ
jgi:hypothetical protein